MYQPLNLLEHNAHNTACSSIVIFVTFIWVLSIRSHRGLLLLLRGEPGTAVEGPQLAHYMSEELVIIRYTIHLDDVNFLGVAL